MAEIIKRADVQALRAASVGGETGFALVPDQEEDSRRTAEANLAKDLADAMDEALAKPPSARSVFLPRSVTVGVLADAIRLYLDRHPRNASPAAERSIDGNMRIFLNRS